MQRDVEQGLWVLGITFIVSTIPALLTGVPFSALQFGIAFTGLFVLPLVPWVLMLEWGAFERFALALVVGLAGMPIAYFIIGVVHGPLNLITFLLIPLIVFVTGFVLLKRKRGKNVAAATPHATTHHPASAQTTAPVTAEEKSKP
jgi:hypothetical protein